jgi:hypothetical protein
MQSFRQSVQMLRNGIQPEAVAAMRAGLDVVAAANERHSRRSRMQKAIRLAASIAVVFLWHAAAIGAPTLLNGDRWPQTAAHAVALDATGHVFLGRGNVLTILGADLSYVASTTLDGEIQGIYYASQRIYAAMGSDGLQIVDVTDLAAPLARAIAYHPDSGVDSVFVNGNDAYIIGLNRLAVVDVSDPDHPAEKGAATLEGLFVISSSLSVSGNIAAVTDQVNGLHLIDVTDPLHPAWQSVTAIAGAWDVAVSGNRAVVVSANGELDIVDISNLASPALLGRYAETNAMFLGLAVTGDIAYVADENNGLRQVDISDPAHPALLQIYSGTRGAYSVATNGSDVWVGDFTQGLQRIAGSAYDTPADARDVFIGGDYYLYVVDDGVGSDNAREGLRILDAFNLGNFVFKGFVATPGEASAVFAAGDYAYVADGSAGLQIIDVAGRTGATIFMPQIVGTLDTAGTAQDVSVSGDYAYVADGSDGLRIIDISNPAQPTEAGFFDTNGSANAVAVFGHYAYIADGTAGLQILDVSDPTHLLQSGFIALPGNAQDVALSGGNAFVAAGSGGLQIVNLASVTITGSYDTGGNATGVSVSGNYARVADGSTGLVTLDISNPAAPTKVEAWSVETNGTARKTVSIDEFVIVAEDKGGAVAYKLSDEVPFIPASFNPPDDSAGCFIGAAADAQ